MGLTKQQHQIMFKYQEKCDEDPEMIWQAFGEENMIHTQVFEWQARFRADRKR
jgi:hypothetical protein